ncbi:hypothetical protein J2W37_002909 [Variovorax paradoxus]|uniref:DUF2894 domain-containing protein n=1 Tax=Variovorax paradoxus TaxID=34073 RepID=A0AAE3Y2Z5_VARPD|nr:DUF2894 domain-containing protein [Variovorax paradoxus]MDP9965189.1 hypothetical protein [Variovorax paradoxus]MDR6428376.1 hypothetical protein [Variovorax paradoxus]MDR6455029.1 hypothetical protein [Variovorax paradoxus]
MSSSSIDPAAVLDAWRAQGGHRRDPVRFRFIEALARRAAAHEGDARRILDERLAVLLAAYRGNLEEARHADGLPAVRDASAKQAARPSRGPLAELVEHMARQAPPQGDDGAAADDAVSATPELKTLRYFRSTWSRLSADRRLTQSLAKVPENAGPLNSHHLVHRSLMLMHELSPEYLNRFMSYVDTLLWVDQLNGSNGPAAANAPRAEGPKKNARGKSG